MFVFHFLFIGLYIYWAGFKRSAIVSAFLSSRQYFDPTGKVPSPLRNWYCILSRYIDTYLLLSHLFAFIFLHFAFILKAFHLSFTFDFFPFSFSVSPFFFPFSYFSPSNEINGIFLPPGGGGPFVLQWCTYWQSSFLFLQASTSLSRWTPTYATCCVDRTASIRFPRGRKGSSSSRKQTSIARQADRPGISVLSGKS